MNKFKIIITSYNNEMWTEMCVGGLINQTYKNFEVLFFDDASTDTTYDIAKSLTFTDSRFKLFKSTENKTKSYYFSTQLTDCVDDKEILIFLDGDDWLANEHVLSDINDFYNKTDGWLIYGGMKVWKGTDDVEEPFPQNSDFSYETKTNKLYQYDLWRSSHIKTMRGFVWNRINKSVFISTQDNRYILGGDDLAFMFPALELCPSNKIFNFNFPTYIYNATDSHRIHNHMTSRGINYESEIRSRQKHKEILTVTSELSGGIGNQLFQISAALTKAKELNGVAIFDENTHFLPSQGNKIGKYKKNILRNIIFQSNIKNVTELSQQGFHYTPIPNPTNNCILKGGYQSEKFFDKQLISKTFSIPTDIQNYLESKHKNVNSATSMHIRRGDYLKLYPHHISLNKEYYIKAMETINSDNYFIFSDDIAWCKSEFKGDRFTFISDEDYNELYLMTLCKNNIIANSTFSWWGAWLNINKNKTVIAPKKWFGPAYNHYTMDDLLPKEWIKL